MVNIIEDYVNKNDWRVNENANTGFSFSGLKSYIASTFLANDSLSKLPKNIRDAHKNGEIHIHDLDGGIGIPYCFGADLQQLLFEGLKNPSGSNSNPAKHFDTVVDHIVNYVYISQSEFNGAQAHSNFDTLLSPFVIGLDYKTIKQNIQRLIYNISYPLRSAFQTPFYNTSFDLIVPEHMKNEPIVIGGKTSESMIYGDMQNEMDLINKAFLELMLEGDSQRKPFTFPIPTYGITKELLNKNDDVTNLLWQLSAKFGNPNFMNYIGTGNSPSDVRALCCRLNLDISKLRARGLWNMGAKTGSLGVCTLNLNRASKDGYDHFIENVDNYYDLAIEELLIKNKYIHESFNKGLLPFTKCYLDNKEPFKSFFHTIGIHAMNEACLNMFNSSIESNQDVVIETLKHIRNRVDETSEETGILHNLEETPCFTADTKVSIKHRNQYKRINISDLEKYNIEDVEFLTENGYVKIKRFIKLIYNDNLLHIELRNGSYMNVTNEHPCIIKSDNGYKIKRADELTTYDYMAFLDDIAGGSLGDYDLGRYIGLYAAEGCEFPFGIKFTLNINEEEYSKFIKDFSEKRMGAYCKEQFVTETNCRKIYVFGRGCKGLVSEFVLGNIATKKRLSSTILNTSIDFRNGLINGMWEGDGRKELGGALHLGSRELIIGIADIMNSVGRKYTFSTKKYDNKISYYLYEVNGNSERCNPEKKYIKENGFYWIKISNIERKNTKVKYVYDIELESNTHLIRLANGIITHNCEGTTRRLAKLDKKFGLPTQGKDVPFLTNSTHCPVDTIYDWSATISIQEKFKEYYSGGTILHGFIGDYLATDGAEKIIKQMSVKTKIPYYNLTPTYSICHNHGRFSGRIPQCPICNEVTYIYSRVVGYLQPVYQKWNDAKREEFKMRKEYKIFPTWDLDNPKQFDKEGYAICE